MTAWAATSPTQVQIEHRPTSPIADEPVSLRHWRMGDRDTDITDHLDWCRDLAGYTDATLRARRWVLNRMCASIDRPLRTAEIGHLMQWEQTVVAGLAPESRRAYVGHVRAFYRWALVRGLVSEDPTVMLTRPKVPKPLPKPIGEQELATALAAASPKLAAMMTLMAYAGLRCMEVAALTWPDIVSADGHTWLTVRSGKGGKDRHIPVGEVVLRALHRHGTRARGPVFLGRDGQRLRGSSVSSIINDHLRRCGIASSAHKLRARYATQAARVLDTPLVAELCGWESLETARHYVKPDPERSAQLVAALDALAMPKPRQERATRGQGAAR
jgi:integrase